MADVQTKNGYTQIANEIIEALWMINLSPYESRVLWFLIRKTYGWKKKTDWIASSQFSKNLGLDRRLIFRALKSLSSKQMIVINRDDKNRVTYGFQKNYEKWKVSSKKMTVISRDDGVSSAEMHTKETITKETKKNILPAKAVNPDIKIFLDYAYQKFFYDFGEKMHIDGGKDGATVKKLLSTYGLDKLKGLWDVFMQSEDAFIRQAGYTIGVFKSQINKLVVKDKVLSDSDLDKYKQDLKYEHERLACETQKLKDFSDYWDGKPEQDPDYKRISGLVAMHTRNIEKLKRKLRYD